MKQNSIIVLSSRNIGRKHVSYNTVRGLEEEFIKLSGGGIITFGYSHIFVKYNRVMHKLGFKSGISDRKVVNEIRKRSDCMVFFSIMGTYEAKNHMPTLKKIHNQLILYVFDCWESDYGQWEAILDEIQPKCIFFAYKKAKEHFSAKFANCFYMPQSMDTKYFYDYGQNKKRLFMQMGRRTESLHRLVLQYLEEKKLPDENRNYIYEREKGKIIFESTDELAREINATYFFIAAPQNIENRKITGDISEVTARFYEAMACKTLIIGIKPQDTFDELFPYENAMIEIDEENFAERINELLNDENKYKEIVEYNFEYVMNHHRWKNRFEEMMIVLKSI